MTDHYIKAYFDNCADALKLKTKFEASNVTQRDLFIKDVFKIYLGRIFFFFFFFFFFWGGGGGGIDFASAEFFPKYL